MILIHLKVHFGNQRTTYDQSIQVKEGSTPKKAVAQVFPIESGKVCCDEQEVVSIDGVAVSPNDNLWWYCSVNGEGKTVSPHKTKLNANDSVEWTYVKKVKNNGDN